MTVALEFPEVPSFKGKTHNESVFLHNLGINEAFETPEAKTEKALQELEENALKTHNKGVQQLFSLYKQFCQGKKQCALDKIHFLLKVFQESVESCLIGESQFLKDYGITFFNRKGRYYLRPVEVWQPDEWSTVYSTVLQFYEGKNVLSAGCGSGWVEIEGIKKHNPQKVTTMDIIPEAVLTTRINAFWHEVQDLITVYLSDGFDVLMKGFETKSKQIFDISHFCAPQVFRPQDLAKLKLGDMSFDELEANETGDYFKPDGEDIYGFGLNIRLIRQSREMGVKRIFANMALRLPESILQTACFGPTSTIGQLVAVNRVEMHPGTSLEHLLWLEREYNTPTVFYNTGENATPIDAEQANICLSQSTPVPVFHDVGLFVLTNDPITSLTTYIELSNATDIPYDDIPGALPIRQAVSRVFGEAYSSEELTICPDSKQAWRNIEELYEQPLEFFDCVDILLQQLGSQRLNSQVIKLSLSQQSTLLKMPLLFASACKHGATIFLDVTSKCSQLKDFSEELRNLVESQPPPENVHFVWTEAIPGDQEKTMLLSKNRHLKNSFDATVELTWSRVSLLAQFSLQHHLIEKQIIPRVKRISSKNWPSPKAAFKVHKSFNSDVLESSRLGQIPCLSLDYGANRVDERASIAKKWGIPRLKSHISRHGFKSNQDLQSTFKSFLKSRFHLNDGTVITANGVSDIFNAVAIHARNTSKSVGFPVPGYGEFLENARSLLEIKTYSLISSADGKLTPSVIQDYLEKFPNGIVYWNMPYPNPTGAGYSDQEINRLITTMNCYPFATLFVDAVFLDTGDLFKEYFDLSALELPYIIATGLSKSIGGPGCRVGGCLISSKDVEHTLKEHVSVPAVADITLACLYYEAIQKRDSELLLHLKEQSLLLQEKRKFVIKHFARIGMKPIVIPEGGLFVAFSSSALYGKMFSDPTSGQVFQLNHKTLGMALESCGLRINTPSWTGNKSIVRVVISEPYSLLKKLPCCIDRFKQSCNQQSIQVVG